MVLAMRPGFRAGFVLGGLASLGLGIAAATLPGTPTWALWRLVRALDRHDAAEIQACVDLPAVVAHALADGTEDAGDLERLALAALRGERIETVLEDPAISIGPIEVAAAWWSIERSGDRAALELRLGPGRTVRLGLARDSGSRWRVTSVAPLAALLRIAGPPPDAPPISPLPPSPRAAVH